MLTAEAHDGVLAVLRLPKHFDAGAATAEGAVPVPIHIDRIPPISPSRIRPDTTTSHQHRKQTNPYSPTMATNQADYKDRQFLAVIGDEDSVTGLLLAGIGHVTNPPDSQKNFLVVDSKTETSAIESAFDSFTTQRKDIGIVLINQHVADKIRHRIDTYTAAFPTILEIPSKEHPYDPEKDSVLRRVRRLFGE
ncbi:hypothetical protein NPX13_g4231 [Xylaria arbuscula]|uniref:V-type proton ATPase subunit F n=1 Tax=Xylaria arbuscula TaxID=114810 RepID=A0A9W8NGR0_9PEZI|nr:hypothetical protein NPX13_g4231 [Xylaria arbuscula]